HPDALRHLSSAHRPSRSASRAHRRPRNRNLGPGPRQARRMVAQRSAGLLACTRRATLALLFLVLLPAAAHVIQVTGVTIRLDPARTTVSITAHLPLLANSDPAIAI